MRFLDIAPVTPAMEARFFIQDNLGLIIGAAVLLAIAAGIAIIIAVRKNKK